MIQLNISISFDIETNVCDKRHASVPTVMQWFCTSTSKTKSISEAIPKQINQIQWLSQHIELCALLFVCLCIRRWSLNGTLINLRTDSRRRLSGGNLVIRSLDRAQDGGIYQCTAFNPLGGVLSRRASLQFACKPSSAC